MTSDNGDSHEDEPSLVINREEVISTVKRMKDELKASDLTDYELWEAFRDELHGYTLQHLECANRVDLREDVNFNHSIIANVMFIEGSPVLHIVDEGTRYQAARWLKDMSVRHV